MFDGYDPFFRLYVVDQVDGVVCIDEIIRLTISPLSNVSSRGVVRLCSRYCVGAFAATFWQIRPTLCPVGGWVKWRDMYLFGMIIYSRSRCYARVVTASMRRRKTANVDGQFTMVAECCGSESSCCWWLFHRSEIDYEYHTDPRTTSTANCRFF